MRTFIYLILLLAIGGILSMMALGSNSWVPIFIFWGLKGLFIYGVVKRINRKKKEKEDKELFQEYMRSQIKYNQRY